jgi:hypothetical protein
VAPVSDPDRPHRLSPWGRLVAVCAVIVGVTVVAMTIWAIADRAEQRVSYSVGGMLSGLTLDVGDADVLITGAGEGSTVSVRHVDRYGFGHDARVRRSIGDGVFRVWSRCPRTVLHGCSVSYSVAVPDNLPLTIRTGDGSVTLRGYRGSARITTGDGDVDVTGWCGFSLLARSEGHGDVRAGASCAPQRLSLRSTTGAVQARVPAGRYRLDASTAGGSPVVRGIAADADAPNAIQALSSSGAVVVERGS